MTNWLVALGFLGGKEVKEVPGVESDSGGKEEVDEGGVVEIGQEGM